MPRQLTTTLFLGLLAGSVLTGIGCGGHSDTIAITQIDMTEEQATAIRSHDAIVDEEEGGAAKVKQAVKSTRKVARKPR